jgi:hypothetical protein
VPEKRRKFLFILAAIIFASSSSVFAGGLKVNDRQLANFIPSEEVQPYLGQAKGMYHYLTIEDNKGILKETKNQIQDWDRNEEFVRNWSLDGFGKYKITKFEEKKKYLDKRIIKYFDKRLSGEIKSAEEGTTLHRVGQLQKALKPSATLKVSNHFKFKFKARILEGEVKVMLDSTFFKYQTEINRKGDVKMKLYRSFDEIGLHSEANYNPNDKVWVTSISKTLPYNMTAQLSSSQNDKTIAFSSNSNNILQFGYHRSF